MRAPLRLLPLLLLVAFQPAYARAQAPAAREQKGTATVSGRVTTADGKAAAGVGVSLVGVDSDLSRKPVARGVTDAEGRYRLANVPAGRFYLQVFAPLFVMQERGDSWRPNSRALSVSAGEAVEHVDFTLVRGGVITGRVTTDDGKPVVAQRVNIQPADKNARTGPGGSAFQPFAHETDDRGVYRVYGLAPGRYLVSIGEGKNDGSIRVGLGTARYARTFHPNATEESQAKEVEVVSGQEATGVDITLAGAAKTYTASGRMIDADTGKPAAGLMYGYGALGPDGKSLGAFGADGGRSDANGEFRLKNLLPGRYAAFAVDFEQNSTHYSDTATFEIDDADVSGLVIKVRRGATVTGVAVIEGTSDRAVLQRLPQLSLQAMMEADRKTGEVQAPAFSQARIMPDGSFQLQGLRPGKARIALGGWPPPKGFVLLGIERGGVEVRDTLEVGGGEQITGVRIRIGYGTSSVRGQVEVRRDGRPAALPPEARLAVSARRLNTPAPAWGGHSGEVDERGRFLLDGLPAGDYELTVRGWIMSAPGQPAAAQLPAVKQTVNVPDAGQISVTIIYDLGAKQPENDQ